MIRRIILDKEILSTKKAVNGNSAASGRLLLTVFIYRKICWNGMVERKSTSHFLAVMRETVGYLQRDL